MTNRTDKIILFLLLICILLILFFYLKSNSKISEISFSKESGFYDDDFEVEIKGEGDIYYTLDGSIPTKQSNRYTAPIHITDASKKPNTNSMNKDVSPFFNIPLPDSNDNAIKYEIPNYLIDKCNVVRAVSFLNDGRKTDVISASYFVGFKEKEVYQDIGIISLITEPDNLFDKKKGIYVLGDTFVDYSEDYLYDANFRLKGKVSERKAYIEIFDKNKDLILQRNIGIRIHGRYTRERNPKSLNFYFGNEYDKENDFYGDIIDENYNPKSLTLLYPSTDESRMKDFLVMSLYTGKNVATMKFKPYLLFLDGEYWGFYYLTEKYSKDFVSYHYKIKNINNIVVAKTEDKNFAEFKFQDICDFCYGSDFSKSGNYNTLCSMIDIDSFVEYISVLTYVSRVDGMLDNCGVWKTLRKIDNKYQSCKWFFMLYDMDSICSEGENSDINMILSLMKTKQFKEKFNKELIRLSKEDFEPMKVENFIKRNGEYIKKYVLNDYKRFYGMDERESNKIFEENTNKMVKFFKYRQNNISEYFDKK